jgi:hypothetical protein
MDLMSFWEEWWHWQIPFTSWAIRLYRYRTEVQCIACNSEDYNKYLNDLIERSTIAFNSERQK